MPDWSQVRSDHVMTAIQEHDRLGSRDFLGRYGYRRSHSATLWHRGSEYDPGAILGAAFEHATGQSVTGKTSGAESDAVSALTGLGFDVVTEEPPVLPSRRKAAPVASATPDQVAPDEVTGKKATATRAAKKAPAKKVAVPEPVVRLCPRCHVAVPATGVCDFCD